MPGNDPIRQHWVPRVYLRAFCASPVDQEQIHGLNLETGNAFFTSVDRVAVQKHFYTLGRDTASPSYAVETALERLESDVGPILADIRRDEILPAGDRLQMLARFLGSLHMRSRQGLQTIHGWRDDVGACAHLYSFSNERRAELNSLSDEEMRELFARSAVVVGGRIGDRLLKFEWRLIRADEGFFFTSENPVLCCHPSEVRWGLEMPGTHTLCPLSPTLLLHMSPEPVLHGEGTLHAPAAAVRGLNGLLLLSAEQFLYADRPFEAVSELLQERTAGTRRAFGPA